MDWEDFKDTLRLLTIIAVAIVGLLLLCKLVGVMFNMPKDYNRQVSERNINICVTEGGMPVMDDNYYKNCERTK